MLLIFNLSYSYISRDVKIQVSIQEAVCCQKNLWKRDKGKKTLETETIYFLF